MAEETGCYRGLKSTRGRLNTGGMDLRGGLTTEIGSRSNVNLSQQQVRGEYVSDDVIDARLSIQSALMKRR